MVEPAKWIEGVRDIVFGLLRRADRWDVISISTAAKGLLAPLLIGGLMWKTRSLPLALAVVAGWHLALLGG